MFQPIWIGLITFVLYIFAYHSYGKFLSRKLFFINPKNPVPSHTNFDGKDFVPSTKQVMFGHHFTSIAGTGPIVGPAIGIIWGWVPALIWVVVGSIFMGAVHDFGALVVSLRNQGRSLADITGDLIHKRARTCFFIIVFLALWIVIAIFGLVIALIFAQFPTAVIAVWLEIPIAILFGKWLARSQNHFLFKTIVSVALLYGCVYLGILFPVTLPSFSFLPATGLWTIILLIYAFIASVLPVGLLLQPRDYLNAWQLYIAVAIIVAGMVVSGLTGQLNFVAPAVNLAVDSAPSMWPFLFITIACGAISGFHCLVCSGTSAKQLDSEADAQYVGYGSMLVEGALAVIVLIAVGAGIGMGYEHGGQLLTGSAAFNAHYASWQSSAGLGSKLTAVVIGCANMMSSIGVSTSLAIAIVGVFIASFAGTTLDSATRIQRYVISEFAKGMNWKRVSNKYSATAVAVLTGLLLAFSSGLNGKGALLLWPIFGAVNQLLGGLALIVISVYVAKKSSWVIVTLIPCMCVLGVTIWASVLNQITFLMSKNYLLSIINSVILVLACFIAIEAIKLLPIKLDFKRKRAVKL